MAGRVEMLAFLFTDIEGSTNLLRELGDRYRTLLLDHRSLLTTAFERSGGRLLGSEGDSLFAVFPTPEDALVAATEGQLLLGEATWPDGIALKVRMGVHIGEVIVETVDERDDAVNVLGAKGGVGEMGIVGMPAAIANAVHHATGKRVRRVPILIDDLV